LVSALIAPGFFQSQPVQTALAIGGVVALVSGIVGVFTVVRGQSFAGHAFSDMGTLGGSGSFLLSVNPLWGFVGVGVIVSGALELLGVQNRRGRDVATGIVLGAALGISALFLYFDTTIRSTSGATITILFGSLFTVSGATVPITTILGALAALAVLVIYRPLLLSSVSTDMAGARGVPVRAISLVFLLVMGVSVSLSSLAVGTILSPALLIGPAATALRFTKRPGTAMLAAGGIGIVATWLGILLAYDSYYWPPAKQGWPVSFLVVALVFTFYLSADLASWLQAKRASKLEGGHGPGPSSTRESGVRCSQV